MRLSNSISTLAGTLTTGVFSMSGALAADSYAEDRAQIESLQARYMFALEYSEQIEGTT